MNSSILQSQILPACLVFYITSYIIMLFKISLHSEISLSVSVILCKCFSQVYTEACGVYKKMFA